MKLTILNRFKLCFEILFTRSGHNHPSFEKQLSTFQRGYSAGMEEMQEAYEQNKKIITSHLASLTKNRNMLNKVNLLALGGLERVEGDNERNFDILKTYVTRTFEEIAVLSDD